MATGKSIKDIFQSTAAKAPKVGLDAVARSVSKAGKDYRKVTVCLYPKNIDYLDEITLAIRKRTGQTVKRAELVRALVEQAEEWLKPGRDDFDKVIRSLKLV